MIGYPIARTDLEALIEQEKPGWLQRATDRTETFRAKGRYEEKSSIWSDVKRVYMKLQGDCKCAYCERKLESIPHGRIEQDVEHFRPKKSVGAYEMPHCLRDHGIDATQVPNEDRGYYLLAYHPFNYAAACKPCNRAKTDYFPIADDYDLAGEDPAALLNEKPYLIYPLGHFDEAPQNLIQFYGLSPQAAASSGHERARALVTIELLQLDKVAGRKNLLRERAVIIVALYPQLERLANGATGTEEADAQNIVAGFTQSTAPHTNCSRSFKRLFESDRAEAKAIFDRAVQLIMSIS